MQFNVGHTTKVQDLVKLKNDAYIINCLYSLPSNAVSEFILKCQRQNSLSLAYLGSKVLSKVLTLCPRHFI